MNIMEQKTKMDDIEVGTIYKDSDRKFFKIDYASSEDSPRWIKEMNFYTWLRGYKSPDPCSKTFQEFCEEFEAKDASDLFEKMREKGYYARPVYVLIHSSIHYSLKPFNDRWDSGLGGVIFRERNGNISDEEEMLDDIAQNEVSEYDAWANGEIYVAEQLDDEAAPEAFSSPFFARSGEEWSECLKEAIKSIGIKDQDCYDKAKQKTILE